MIAQAIPPGYPYILPYIPRPAQISFCNALVFGKPLPFDHNLTARRATLKGLCCGMQSSNSRTVRAPLMLRIPASSSPRRQDRSVSSRSDGICDMVGSDTKRRSMLTPRNSSFIMGTCASGTGTNSVISDASLISLKVGGKCSKKSSMYICFGATMSVSISEPRLLEHPRHVDTQTAMYLD